MKLEIFELSLFQVIKGKVCKWSLNKGEVHYQKLWNHLGKTEKLDLRSTKCVRRLLVGFRAKLEVDDTYRHQ